MDDYDLAIEKLKIKFPEYKDVRFELSDGELSYWHSSYKENIDMMKMQDEINDILGQKKYQATLISYKTCYARNEEEAEDFIKAIKTKNTLIQKIYVVS
jgi:hypothetical protein